MLLMLLLTHGDGDLLRSLNIYLKGNVSLYTFTLRSANVSIYINAAQRQCIYIHQRNAAPMYLYINDAQRQCIYTLTTRSANVSIH